MGRERYWGSGKSTKRARGGGERDNTPSGCMSAVFQFFDFHHFRLCLHHEQQQPSFLPEEPIILKGVEAPTNSLELDEASMEAASLPPVMNEEEENLNIPMGIQIKTSGATRPPPKVVASHDVSSENSYSPGTKTPNLVARLMGLDLLPDKTSPSSSSSSSLNHSTTNPSHSDHFRSRQTCPIRTSTRRHFLDNHIIGTRSLPETPRVSSARRSDMDHHRLSLQINKENVEELECSRCSSTMAKRRELKVGNIDESRSSPSHIAGQIVKQVEENLSRKVGLDITNTIRNRDQGRDEQIIAIKSKKYSKVFAKVGDELSPGKLSTPSCSPRVRFLESKNKPVTVATSSIKDQTSRSPRPLSSLSSSSSSSSIDYQSQFVNVSLKPKSQPLQEQQKSIQKCKNATGERMKKPLQTPETIRNKQGEPFVRPSTATRANISDKKCKKTPLSNALLNITVPTFLPVKKDPSPPATKLPQKQSQVPHAQASKWSSQLSSCSSQKYKATQTLGTRDNDDNNLSSGGAEFQYVTGILKRTGIDRDTLVSFTRWFSPSHPLDPSIFHHLEHSFSFITITKLSQLNHRCNRKLIFHLTDEILVAILKPYINMKPWVHAFPIYRNQHMKGCELIEILCAKMRSFPSSNCQDVQDIDAIIDKDLHEVPAKQEASMAYEEEGEAIVMDIEKDIMDSLVYETVVFCGVVLRGWQFRTEMGLM